MSSRLVAIIIFAGIVAFLFWAFSKKTPVTVDKIKPAIAPLHPELEFVVEYWLEVGYGSDRIAALLGVNPLLVLTNPLIIDAYAEREKTGKGVNPWRVLNVGTTLNKAELTLYFATNQLSKLERNIIKGLIYGVTKTELLSTLNVTEAELPEMVTNNYLKSILSQNYDNSGPEITQRNISK